MKVWTSRILAVVLALAAFSAVAGSAYAAGTYHHRHHHHRRR